LANQPKAISQPEDLTLGPTGRDGVQPEVGDYPIARMAQEGIQSITCDTDTSAPKRRLLNTIGKLDDAYLQVDTAEYQSQISDLFGDQGGVEASLSNFKHLLELKSLVNEYIAASLVTLKNFTYSSRRCCSLVIDQGLIALLASQMKKLHATYKEDKVNML
jgi:hypothetical protein